MMSLKMGSSSFNPQSNRGIMDEKSVDDDGISISSSDVSSVVSSEDLDLFDEVNSSSGSSSPINSSDHSASSSSHQLVTGALQDMSALLQELPFKRGLSKHYNGKSQSFTSLANVRSLEDLAKPENPYKKKLKSCKSYGGFLESHGSSHHPIRSNSSSKLMSKKASRGSSGSLCVKRNSSFIGNRPPIPPPHKSSSMRDFEGMDKNGNNLFIWGVKS